MPTTTSLRPTLAFVVFFLAIALLALLTPLSSANEFGLFQEGEPFTLHIPIRVGLVGFNTSNLFIDPKPLIRSLRYTLNSYTPVNLDTGEPYNVQYQYQWDVYHVSEEIQTELEGVLASAMKPTVDMFGKPVYTTNPRKVNALDQMIPLNKQEATMLKQESLGYGTQSPLYEIDVSEVDLQLSDIVFKALSRHLKARPGSRVSQPHTAPSQTGGYSQSKKGADKEYSIFIYNTRREELSNRYIQITNDTNQHMRLNDFIYGYTTRKMSEVIDARRNVGVDGGGHFGAYAYTNTWVASGRAIFADLQALSSAGTPLDRSDYFLEELLSSIYKNIQSGTSQPTGSPQNSASHGQNSQQGSGSNAYGGNVDLLHSGLLSWRYEQQKSNKMELSKFYQQRAAGSILSTSRANSIVPSLYDTSSLTTIANPTGISTYQHYGMGRSATPPAELLDQAVGKPHPSKHLLGARITPLIASFIASATKQGLTTDIYTPQQQIPFFGRTQNSEETTKQYIDALQNTVLTVPILLLTDHSYNLQLQDVVDMRVIEKMLAKLSLSKTVKVVPLLHNVHTLPAVSTALFSSLDMVQFNTQTHSFFPGQSQKTILNGDNVSAALYRASHTNPILASVVPSGGSGFNDLINQYSRSWKTGDKTNAMQKAHFIGHHETLPVFLFSLVALPTETTVIYPSQINPETQDHMGSSTTGAAQKSYILHLHDIHTIKNAAPEKKERLQTMLRKELTLKVLDSLITRLTGVIPPYVKYKMQNLAIRSGLTSPRLLLAQRDASRIGIDQRSVDQRVLQNYDQLQEFRKQQMQHLIQDNNNLPRSNSRGLVHGVSNNGGSALQQYIDSTWSLGLHPFGPYSTLYKCTKIYRDAAKRNVLIHTVSQLISTTWKTIHNTCGFISNYGFLIANLKPGYLTQLNVDHIEQLQQTMSQSQTTFSSTSSSYEHSWNDIVGYVYDQGILESQLNCILYFTQGYFTPEGVVFKDDKTVDMAESERILVQENDNLQRRIDEMKKEVHQQEEKQRNATPEEIAATGTTTMENTISNIQMLRVVQENLEESQKTRGKLFNYAVRRSHVLEWLKSNELKVDDRMLDYLSIHPNAPIYVLQQLGWFVESLSLVDRQFTLLQQVLNNNVDFLKNTKYNNFNDYWLDVFTQLYLLIDKVSILQDVGEMVTVNIKQTYSSCRVLQVAKGADFTTFGRDDDNQTPDGSHGLASGNGNLRYTSTIEHKLNPQGNSQDKHKNQNDPNNPTTLVNAFKTSTVKNKSGGLKQLLIICLVLTALFIALMFACTFSWVDVCCPGGFSEDGSKKRPHQRTTSAFPSTDYTNNHTPPQPPPQQHSDATAAMRAASPFNSLMQQQQYTPTYATGYASGTGQHKPFDTNDF